MEQNIKNKTGLDKTIFWMLKSLLCSYLVTGILLLILAGILYKFNLDEAKVTAGILIIYVLSAFAGGFVIGKITGTKKFFWGLLVGIFYAVLLVLVSFGLYRSIQGSVSELVTTFLVCAGGGLVGGMIS